MLYFRKQVFFLKKKGKSYILSCLRIRLCVAGGCSNIKIEWESE